MHTYEFFEVLSHFSCKDLQTGHLFAYCPNRNSTETLGTDLVNVLPRKYGCTFVRCFFLLYGTVIVSTRADLAIA